MKNSGIKAFSTALFLALAMFAINSCWDEQHPGTYYTFSGKTIASDLEDNPDFSEFVKVLKRAELWSELSTYGEHTCFAPNNESVMRFIQERSIKDGAVYTCVEDLPKDVCDTLAWTHLLDITCFVGEMTEGPFPKVNLNDRYLNLTFDSALKDNSNGVAVYELRRRINHNSVIIARDDTCANGVVHLIDNCIDFTGDYVYDLVDNDPQTLLFSEALKLTGFHKLLNTYYDDTYKIGSDSVDKGVALTSAGNQYTVYYWEKKKTMFTLLVEPDTLYKKNGINRVLPDMFDYAAAIYDEYNDVDSIMSDYTNPLNPLNRFIAYHILPFQTNLKTINGRSDIIKIYNANITDPEDYFETVAPRTMVRISTEYKNGKIGSTYINRRDNEGNGTLNFKGSKERGIKILPIGEMKVKKQAAMNGIYYYIDDILKYDKKVREDILDRRLRIDCTTLSPDFITSGGRQLDPNGKEKIGTGFKDPVNFVSFISDYTLSVRAPAKNSYAYEGDGIDIEGNFDMYVKLPPIPHDGTWQLRLSFRSNSLCGIVQNYLAAVSPGHELVMTDWKPLGIPVDLRVNLEDPTVGWIKDEDLSDEAAIDALDKSMKNRGWMKGSIAQQTVNGDPHRDINTMGRLILTTEYMYSNKVYYLRIKQLLDNSKAEFLFDYIELVPKTVYDFGEDKQ
ncbi:MAG: fasciclin domain-containing protein [Bacteroidaceae bacterium]